MKTKVWNFLRGTDGAPVIGAKIDVYAYPSGGGAATFANIFPTISGAAITTDTYNLFTDNNGYYEFYVADLGEDPVYGYEFTAQFEVTWSGTGILSGSLDKLQFFDVDNREVDITSLDSRKNKSVSNAQAKLWNDHVTVVTQDDHLQYLRTDGSRELTGDWHIGAGRTIYGNFVGAGTDVNLQVSTPGTAQTGHINISGTIISGAAVTYSLGVGTITPSQQVELTQSLCIPVTISPSTGVIYKGAIRFIHDFKGTNADGYNVFVGPEAGNFTMAGAPGNTFQASYNTIVGALALQNNTSGYNNSVLGYNVLNANTTGHDNIGIGISAISKGTTASYNIGVGSLTLNNLLSGLYNVAVGHTSHGSATTGGYNVGLGAFTLASLTVGSNNTSIGTSSLYNVITGNGNVALGFEAGYYETGSNKLFIDNTTRASEADGRLKALVYGIFAATTTAQQLYVNANLNVSNKLNLPYTTASDIGVIYKATFPWMHDYGSDNIFVGKNSGNFALTGTENIGIGTQVLSSLTSGVGNTALGFQSSLSMTTGGSNVAIGFESLFSCSIGSGNVAIGTAAGYYETGSNKLFIDNITRLSQSDGRLKALIYGIFASTTAGQSFTTNANFGIGTSVFGANSNFVFAQLLGVAPTTYPTSTAQMWVANRGGTSGKASFHLACEDGTTHVIGDYVGLGTLSPAACVHIVGKNGVGADALETFRVVGGAGASTGPGYKGGGITLIGGVGGSVSSAGQGGIITITAGQGGHASTTPGGIGGDLVLAAGAGGQGDLGLGGIGGNVLINAGRGNTGSIAPSAGIGGNVYIAGGVRGNISVKNGNVLLGVDQTNTAIGYVGVNVNTPCYPLDVNGYIRLSSIGGIYFGADNTYSANVSAGMYYNPSNTFIHFTTSLEVAGSVGVGGASPTANSPLRIAGLPTSSAGLASGEVWNSTGTLKVV